MNLNETFILAKLDKAVEASGEAIIGTQYGDITVRKDRSGFVAMIQLESETQFTYEASGATNAFLKLADKLKAAEVK